MVLTGVIGTTLLSTASLASVSTSYDMIAMPDFLNQDLGDVSGSPYYKAGMPNSINDSYRNATKFVMDHVEAEGIQDVSIAGDFVEGHWGHDRAGTGVFGPTNNYTQKVAAYKLAAATYYPQTKQLVTDRGLRLFPSIGDHEIWDNNWYRQKQTGYPFSIKAMSMMKNQYTRYMMKEPGGSMPAHFSNRPTTGPARNTAWAYRPDPEVQLVSLDMFQKKNGTVHGSLDVAQRNWMEQVLKKANRDGVDWIIVQGHLPILQPVRYRSSSHMYFEKGSNSGLWKILKQQKIDLYLSGEVHDTTLRRKDGITQLSNGGLLYTGHANYAVLNIRGNTLNITVKEFSGVKDNSGPKLWQTDTNKSKPYGVTYSSAPQVIGTANVTKDNVMIERTGKLTPYKP